MSWEKPSFRQIEMNAEIGSYQDDFGDSPDWIVPEIEPLDATEESVTSR